MLCPSCAHDNIPGVDVCENCGSDLAGLDLPEAQDGVAGRLLTDEIGDLPLAPRVTALPDETVAAVIGRMRRERQGYAMVIEEDRLVGIFTERDVLERTVLEGDPSTPIAELMTRDAVTLRPDQGLAEAIGIMADQRIRHIPLVDRAGRECGLIGGRDVLRYIAEFYPESLINLPPRLDQTMTRPEGG